MSTLGAIFSPLSAVHRHILWNSSQLLVTRSKVIDDIFKVMSSQVKVTENFFEKCTFLVETYRRYMVSLLGWVTFGTG